jgi:hypothetical protein
MEVLLTRLKLKCRFKSMKDKLTLSEKRKSGGWVELEGAERREGNFQPRFTITLLIMAGCVHDTERSCARISFVTNVS